MAITKHAATDETLQQIRLRTMNINSMLSTGSPLDPPPTYGSPTSKHAAYDETLQEILAFTANIDELIEQGGTSVLTPITNDEIDEITTL